MRGLMLIQFSERGLLWITVQGELFGLYTFSMNDYILHTIPDD